MMTLCIGKTAGTHHNAITRQFSIQYLCDVRPLLSLDTIQVALFMPHKDARNNR